MRRLYLMLVCMQVLHSAEEIAFGFYRRTPEIGVLVKTIIPWFPIVSFSAPVFILLNIVLALALLATVLSLYRDVRWIRRIVIAVAVIEFINGAAHIAATAVVGGYFPGAVTAVGLFILSILTLRAVLRPLPR